MHLLLIDPGRYHVAACARCIHRHDSTAVAGGHRNIRHPRAAQGPHLPALGPRETDAAGTTRGSTDDGPAHQLTCHKRQHPSDRSAVGMSRAADLADNGRAQRLAAQALCCLVRYSRHSAPARPPPNKVSARAKLAHWYVAHFDTSFRTAIRQAVSPAGPHNAPADPALPTKEPFARSVLHNGPGSHPYSPFVRMLHYPNIVRTSSPTTALLLISRPFFGLFLGRLTPAVTEPHCAIVKPARPGTPIYRAHGPGPALPVAISATDR